MDDPVGHTEGLWYAFWLGIIIAYWFNVFRKEYIRGREEDREWEANREQHWEQYNKDKGTDHE